MREIETAIKCCISGSCTGCPRQAKKYPAGRADCKSLLYDRIIAALRDNQERDAEIERLRVENEKMKPFYKWRGPVDGKGADPS